jgi:hypothetical protein
VLAGSAISALGVAHLRLYSPWFLENVGPTHRLVFGELGTGAYDVDHRMPLHLSQMPDDFWFCGWQCGCRFWQRLAKAG